MSENSSKMTLEEKLVQVLKDDHLSKLVTDEDVITELVRRSIHEALFKPVTKTDNYRTTETDSPVMCAARQHADALAKAVLSTMTADEVLMKAVRDLVIDMLPQAIQGYLSNNISVLLQRATVNTIEQLQDLKNRKYPPFDG